jgi:hypothetical protein
MTKPGDVLEDLVSGLGPHEGPRARVRRVDIPPDGGLELPGASMDTPADLFVGTRNACYMFRLGTLERVPYHAFNGCIFRRQRRSVDVR